MEEQPIFWSDRRLESDRNEAIAQFRESRLSEDLEEYRDLCEKYHRLTVEVLKKTGNLRSVDSETAVELLTDEEFRYVLRYLTGPPISADDLKTLSDASLAPTKLKKNPENVENIIHTILSALDPMRFEWVIEDREPEGSEVDEALLATAEMIAMRRMGTQRRMGASRRQEDRVESALGDIGMRKVESRDIYSFDSAPETGEFCREAVVLGRKADLVARLWDDRLFLIECKVSNSGVNSVKRLNREAVPKGKHWKNELEGDVVAASVLDGVFKLKNLKDAQDEGIMLFWEHSLGEMKDWILSTK